MEEQLIPGNIQLKNKIIVGRIIVVLMIKVKNQKKIIKKIIR